MAKKKASKKTTGARPRTKAQIIRELAEMNDLTPKAVAKIIGDLRSMMLADVNPRSRKAPGKFTIPGIARVTTRKKPARKARKGINPFNGEETTFKAKPATTVVKIVPVKALKDEVAK